MYAWAYGAGVFVSTNAGSNWSQINSGLTNLKITDLDIFILILIRLWYQLMALDYLNTLEPNGQK